jgi:hypothetical protein
MRKRSPHIRRRRGESGQALVEAALTLPLTVFLILGTLQLFLMQQARIMAEYAAFRAVRAGSVNHGDCVAMTHAAIGALLPTFERVSTPGELGAAFGQHQNNTFGATMAGSRALGNVPIVWLFRESPLASEIPGGVEDREFDTSWDPMRLEVRLVFWFPLRIPFADWVITRMLLAHYGMLPYTSANPLLLTQGQSEWPGPFTTDNMANYEEATVVSQYQSWASGGYYLFPIMATHSMRMMTPAKAEYFAVQNCPPTP